MLPALFICTSIVGADSLAASFATSLEEIETAHLTTSASVGQNEDIARYPATPQHKKSSERSRPTAEEIWQGIKVAAQNEVRSNSPLIIFPTFSVKYIGSTRQLTIVKGNVGALGFRDDPYELPFKKQILIEALRRSLAETDLAASKAPATSEGTPIGARGGSVTESYWRPYLVSAENLVKKAIVDIESDPDKNSLKVKLEQDETQVNEILDDRVYQAVAQEAQHNGYNVIYGRGGGDIKKFSVNLSTAPDGAKIWIMTGLVYRKQLIMKTDPSQWPWIEIVQNPVELLGGYHYRAVWPGGKRAESDIVVDNASPVTLKPN
jgi:hypothetical protein